MAVAVRSNGLHHAVSLGAIEVSSKGCSNRNYDSEDESTKRRLRHTSSTELYPRASIYSKGDIREQYCLTDRQLNSIERPRRDRFFGCLSRRSAHRSQSFLGVCVGRRAPSDENLASYAPFQKYPRYHHNNQNETPFDLERENSYFRRQPASILSTGKMTSDGPCSTTDGTGTNDGRRNWIAQSNINANKAVNFASQNISTNNPACPAYVIPHSGIGNANMQSNPARTKHVSFARSHTLTSFNDANLGFQSLDRVKAAQSQERLIGGKKPLIGAGPGYQEHQQQQNQQIFAETGASPYTIHQQHQHQHLHQHAPPHTHQAHIYPSYNIQAGHAHQHHHLPVHIHQYVPAYNANIMGKIHTEQPIPLGVGVLACAGANLPPKSPEVVVVEKKFRNAMKTQATQTDPRKEMITLSSETSPRSLQKVVKVVSQGAQTNGILNKLKMAKDSLEIPNASATKIHAHEHHVNTGKENFRHTKYHELGNDQNNIEYYERPSPPQSMYRRSSYPSLDERDSRACPDHEERFHTKISSKNIEYESQSLPRTVYSHQHAPNEFISHSLPRHYTENSAFYTDDAQASLDFSTAHLLPPPRQYCKDSNDEEDIDDNEETERKKQFAREHVNRRKSLAAVMQHETDENSPFRRDDIRRQSMPVFVKTERLIDGYAPRSSFRSRDKFRNRFIKDGSSDEKEILIDFKPHMSPKPSPKLNVKHRKAQRHVSDTNKAHALIRIPQMSNASSQVSTADDFENNNQCIQCAQLENENDEFSDNENQDEDHLYENIPTTCSSGTISEIKRDQFRKRSVSLDDAECVENKAGVSSPPSPCRDDIANASTYPSSDSLANDVTRDHSDGIWNESQATVLTAEHKDVSDGTYLSSNQLLTPSSKRRNLILQHQQRSSVDTDALDYEEQLTDHSPIYSNSLLAKSVKGADDGQSLSFQQVAPTTTGLSIKTTAPVPPSINITPIEQEKVEVTVPDISINTGSRPMQTVPAGAMKKRNIEKPNSTYKFNLTNTDISECSTNTDDYVTCTDTSKRTQGIKTPPTTTSSSSTTQVPVSTQSSQMDKSHGSSFESASSLHSSRGENLIDDALQLDENSSFIKMKEESAQVSLGLQTDIPQKSPSHSVCSTSSESYNNTGYSENKQKTSAICSVLPQPKDKPRPKPESISDDERSEMRYSSSGYYDSPPHDDVEQTVNKSRRYRLDEERKRRKTTMKLDIEKENMRALTSPIRKPSCKASSVAADNVKEKLADAPTTIVSTMETSPNKMKRFRPKIRRQFRRSSRDDSASRRSKPTLYYNNLPTGVGNTEKLLDCIVKASPVVSPTIRKEDTPRPMTATAAAKSASEGAVEAAAAEGTRLKAKSTESLRSVSPGSDSVFYSEADGTTADQHCQHCGKEMEGGESAALSIGAGDSVESIPYIENEEQMPDQDIVKPPSDFADSPVITKTTQRLYKKVDRRFRSEERGRHYKSRQDNIRAKSEERNREQIVRSPHTLRPSGSSPCVLPDASFEQNQQVIYRGHYDIGRYARLTDADVWAQLDHQSFDRKRERRASTESERSFHSKYQVILHRLVQRRCTLEMYHRQKNNEFGVDKTVVVKSDSGEFGFRIHGSKPVVVAAIEPDTPAESSGLEVGDIIISVNGIQVLDKHHTEVVKIAHDGCETLELKVARTIGVLINEQHDPPSEVIYSGYLWRQSGQAKGLPNAKKWVRRWFCLRSDNCLYYYKTEGSTQPVGAMIMAKHTIDTCPPEVGKPFAFKVDSGEGIPLFVAGDSEELSNSWIKILKQAAAHANPWLDNCARYLYQPPSSIIRPDCFGYLLKLGSRWCGWSRRYCVLKNACLYFYQDGNSKAAFGMACLHGYKVATMSTSASGKKNSFEIIPPEPKLRHYYFCAESEMDKKRWISALEYSIDRWIKSG